jgi:predicted Zn-dependent protease
MVHDFVVVDHRRTGSTRSQEPEAALRQIDTAELRAHLYRDLRRGRGMASFTVDQDADLDRSIRSALGRAGRNIGPSWTLPPPEAPARVAVADSVISDDVAAAAAATSRELQAAVGSRGGVAARAAGGALVLRRARVRCWVDDTRIRTSSGFANGYRATIIEVDAFIALRDGAPGSAEAVYGIARHRSGLRLGARLVTAAGRLRDRARAAALPAGRYDVLLTGDAITGPPTLGHGNHAERYCWFYPVAAQASATLERQGLTRYRPGQSIYPTPPRGDKLTMTSNGTIPFALESRPFGELGEPVRTWQVVSDGVAAGLALDLREAALRKERANGGLSNLVIAPGSTGQAELVKPGSKRPLLRVSDLSWFHADPRTGWCSVELGLAYRTSASTETPTRGGALRANVFELLARARFSKETTSDRWYHGPRAIRIDDVELG